MANRDADQNKTLHERFKELDTERQCALSRKRELAKLTIPSLLPDHGKTISTPLEVPYNTLGAEGVTTLASAITSVAFPLNGQSVFELETTRTLKPDGEDDSEMRAAFNRFERLTMGTLAPTNLRQAIVLAYEHLIVVGDVLLFMDDDLGESAFRIFRLDQFVVRRKHEGQWMEIIVREAINPEWHPELKNIQGPVRRDDPSIVGMSEDWEPLYTKICRKPDGSGVSVVQEFREAEVGAAEHKVSPWMPLRWKPIAGEAYGTSLAEEMNGDLRALDALSKALIDGTMLNAEHRWGVNPSGITEIDDVLDSVNGDFIPVGPGDVFPLQFQNHAQVQAAQVAVAHRENVIGRRFLMNSAVQPTGERVTARQVSILAQELESRLGGTLSTAGTEIQSPIIRRTIFLMGEQEQIPSEISDQIEEKGGFVKISIRAGLEILNREAEREKLDAAIERMRNLPPEALRAFRWPAIARDWWQSMGLESEGRVKTDDEIAEEDKREQQQAIALQAAQAGVNAGVQGAT